MEGNMDKTKAPWLRCPRRTPEYEEPAGCKCGEWATIDLIAPREWLCDECARAAGWEMR